MTRQLLAIFAQLVILKKKIFLISPYILTIMMIEFIITVKGF